MKVKPAKINKPRISKPRTYAGVPKSKKKSLYRKVREDIDRKTNRR